MDCLSSNCTVSGNDRMISCWLCMGNYHLKCTALKARDADALLDPVKSLHWTCASCKKINIEFYKFLKSYKDQFDKLNKDFLSVQSQLAKFGDLFNNFPCLDNFGANANSSNDKLKLDKLPSIPSLVNSPVTTIIVPDAVGDTFSTLSPRSDAVSSMQTVSTLNDVGPSSKNEKSVPNKVVGNIRTRNNSTMPKPLLAVPPRKTIFVSRLASDTSVDDVDFYIKSKFGQDVDVLIQKFKFSVKRSISSFKISTSPDIFSHIVDPNFWPVNTLVREYTYRETTRTNYNIDVARLPSGNSKN